MARTKKTTKRRQTYEFTLRNLDVESILLRYSEQKEASSEDEIEESIVNLENEIGLSDILHERDKISKRSTYVLDPFKGNIKYWINMVDITQGDALPRYTDKDCWWCRAGFKTHPIGCPLKYYPTAKGDTQIKKRIEERLAESNLPLDTGSDYFETEGVFCTFPCVKAYIIEELSKRPVKYRDSLTLLTHLHLKIFGEIIVIPTAGTWKAIRKNWGHLTPEEFRASFGLLEYTETINMDRPLMYSSGVYIREKRIKL